MPYRLLHLTDLHLMQHPGDTHRGQDPWQRWCHVLDSLRDLLEQGHCAAPDLIILGGDLVHHPENTHPYERLAESLEASGIAWCAVPGNHDTPELFQQALGSRFAASLLGGEWELLLVDSTDQPDGRGGGSLSAAALGQLEASLTAPRARHQLVVMHHPLLPVFSQWQDEVKAGNAEAVLALFAQATHLRGMLCGHVHQAHHWRCGHWQGWSTPAVAPQFLPHQTDFALEERSQWSMPAGRWLELFEDGSMQTTVYRFSGIKG